MRKQAKMTAGQASQQVYTAKGRANDFQKRHTVYQHRNGENGMITYKGIQMTPQEYSQSNAQGSQRYSKKLQSSKQIRGGMISADNQASIRSSSQKFGSLER
jgi:hypothetical protein